jgi:flagellum-specific peptidoglycan hydrolase FlgJ
MRRALVDGHLVALGVEASLERIAVALAMLCEEHANGDAVWCHNLGNVDATPDWQGDVFELRAREVIGGRDVMRTKLLRAYPDATAGAAGFWCFLDAPRFRGVLVAMDMGNAAWAAHDLKRGGWYTGSEADYAAAMVAIYRATIAMVSEVGEATGPAQVAP